MLSPRPLILPLIRSGLPKPQHSPCQIFRSQLTRSTTPHLHRPNHTIPHCRPYSSPSPAEPEAPKTYTFEDIAPLAATPSSRRMLIDVREPSEVEQTGRIPGAYSMPLTSNPDAFYLSSEDFFDRFGFEKPRAAGAATISHSGERPEGRKLPANESPFSPKMKEREAESGLTGHGVDSIKVNKEAGGAAAASGEKGQGEGVEEVIFYCKAGVRSRAAARMAKEWEGVKAGQYAEGWLGWEKKGGRIER